MYIISFLYSPCKNCAFKRISHALNKSFFTSNSFLPLLLLANLKVTPFKEAINIMPLLGFIPT